MRSVIDINIEITALDRLSILLSNKIDEWSDKDPAPKRELEHLFNRFLDINEQISTLIKERDDRK